MTPQTAPEPVPVAHDDAAAQAAEKAAREASRVRDEAQAKALVAQAETDVQRARARRALWLKAWEDLLDARSAVARSDFGQASASARRASELAELGLGQLAYPAVK